MNKVMTVSKKLRETKYLLKIISVLLSLFLWFFVLKSQPVSIEEKLLIQYELPEGYTFSKKPIEKINVYLEGLRATLRRSDIEKAKVKLIIAPFKGGGFIYLAEIPVSSIPQPTGVKIKDYHPKKIKLHLEKTTTKRVPINLVLKGALSEELKLNSYEILPADVLISGPETLINSIDKISTQELELSSVKIDELDKKIKINIPDLVDLQELDVAEIRVLLRVEAKEPMRREIEVPIKFITSSGDKFKSSHKVARVMVEYLNTKKNVESKAEGDNKIDINVYADLTRSEISGKKSIVLKIEKTPSFKVIKVEPSYITVE